MSRNLTCQAPVEGPGSGRCGASWEKRPGETWVCPEGHQNAPWECGDEAWVERENHRLRGMSEGAHLHRLAELVVREHIRIFGRAPLTTEHGVQALAALANESATGSLVGLVEANGALTEQLNAAQRRLSELNLQLVTMEAWLRDQAVSFRSAASNLDFDDS